MLRGNFPGRKKQKREEALARQEKRNSRSDREQLAILPRDSMRERNRLEGRCSSQDV